jgi:hypothetical protein
MTTFRLKLTRGPEWIATYEAPDRILFNLDFEATPIAPDGKPIAGRERSFGVDLLLDADLIVSGRWGMYSSGERAVHLVAIARELVQQRGLPRSGRHVLEIDKQTQAGRFAYGSPFDPPLAGPDEVVEMESDEARSGGGGSMP